MYMLKNPRETKKLRYPMVNSITKRYTYTRTKKNMSLMKKVGVTAIYPDSEALKARGITAEVMNSDEPSIGVIA